MDKGLRRNLGIHRSDEILSHLIIRREKGLCRGQGILRKVHGVGSSIEFRELGILWHKGLDKSGLIHRDVRIVKESLLFAEMFLIHGAIDLINVH